MEMQISLDYLIGEKIIDVASDLTTVYPISGKEDFEANSSMCV